VLAETRDQGYGVVDQELEDGLRAVAVPILDARAETFAAVNVSAHASRVSLDELRTTYLVQLIETAAKINADLRSVSMTAGRVRLHRAP
jgi:IclR family pca regulon transcriptional regulator